MTDLGVWLDRKHTSVREDVAHVWPWIVIGFAALLLGLIGWVSS